MPRLGTPPTHTHEGAGEGGQLDWDSIFSDAVHSHQSNAEGGTLASAALPNFDTHEDDEGLHVQAVRKTADETVNNSTTLQDDDALKLALAADEVWEFVLLVLVNTPTNADVKFAITVPSGASFYVIAHGLDAAGAAWIGLRTDSTAFGVYGGGADNFPIVIRGTVVCGSTAGDLQLQWAQNSAQSADTKVLANSALKATKIA